MVRYYDANGRPISEESAQPRRRRRYYDANGNPIEEASPTSTQRRPGPIEDVGRSFVTGLERGVAGIAGFPRDASEMVDAATSWAVQQGANFAGRPVSQDAADQTARSITGPVRALAPVFGGPAGNILPIAAMSPSSEDVNRAIEGVAGPQYEPQTIAGEYARTAGEFVPNALIPGSGLTRLGRVVLPALASESAGQLTEGTPYEGPARFAGAIAGGVVNEAGVAANAMRAARRTAPRPEAEALEQEFGPLTSGERSGNVRQRLEEDDWRRGIGSDQAQSTLRAFDARRARDIRNNATRVVTRGQEPLSQDVGEAGTILGDELRSARAASRARATQQYNAAFEAAKNEPIPAGINELPSVRAAAAAEEFGFEMPSGARAALGNLERQIQEGSATHANVERARQALNRELGAAVNARNDAQEFIMGRIIDAIDEWQSGILQNPAARRAMREARGIYAETANLFGRQGRTELASGHVGRMDPGGRSIDRAINTDLTGEQIIDSIVGAGRRPSQQALGAVRRIKEIGTGRIVYTNRNAESGVRVPGRPSVRGERNSERLDMRLRSARKFAADAPDSPAALKHFGGQSQQPDAVLQSLREGLWHRVLRPIDDYIVRTETAGTREGGLLPAQRMVTQLDNALNGPGREIMETLYTPREMQAMRRLQRYFQSIVPPTGSAYSGTPAGLYRLITGAFDKAVGLIPGLGPVLREALSEANTTGAARRAIAPPRPAPEPALVARPQETPSQIAPLAAGAVEFGRVHEGARRPSGALRYIQ